MSNIRIYDEVILIKDKKKLREKNISENLAGKKVIITGIIPTTTNRYYNIDAGYVITGEMIARRHEPPIKNWKKRIKV